MPRQHRITTAAEYSATSRHGVRRVSPNLIIHLWDRGDKEPTRIGFVVSKSVGDAVQRNLVKRRLRAIGAELIHSKGSGLNIVVRAREHASLATFAELRDEFFAAPYEVMDRKES